MKQELATIGCKFACAGVKPKLDLAPARHVALARSAAGSRRARLRRSVEPERLARRLDSR